MGTIWGSKFSDTTKRRAQSARRYPSEDDGVRSDEDRERSQGLAETGERFVAVEWTGADRRCLRRGEPRLEMHVSDFQRSLGAMGLRVDAADELAVMENRQRVVAVHALRTGRIHLDAVVEAEEPLHA